MKVRDYDTVIRGAMASPLGEPHTGIEHAKLFAFACDGHQVRKKAASIVSFGRVVDRSSSRPVAEMGGSA